MLGKQVGLTGFSPAILVFCYCSEWWLGGNKYLKILILHVVWCHSQGKLEVMSHHSRNHQELFVFIAEFLERCDIISNLITSNSITKMMWHHFFNIRAYATHYNIPHVPSLPSSCQLLGHAIWTTDSMNSYEQKKYYAPLNTESTSEAVSIGLIGKNSLSKSERLGSH